MALVVVTSRHYYTATRRVACMRKQCDLACAFTTRIASWEQHLCCVIAAVREEEGEYTGYPCALDVSGTRRRSCFTLDSILKDIVATAGTHDDVVVLRRWVQIPSLFSLLPNLLPKFSGYRPTATVVLIVVVVVVVMVVVIVVMVVVVSSAAAIATAFNPDIVRRGRPRQMHSSCCWLLRVFDGFTHSVFPASYFIRTDNTYSSNLWLLVSDEIIDIALPHARHSKLSTLGVSLKSSKLMSPAFLSRSREFALERNVNWKLSAWKVRSRVASMRRRSGTYVCLYSTIVPGPCFPIYAFSSSHLPWTWTWGPREHQSRVPWDGASGWSRFYGQSLHESSIGEVTTKNCWNSLRYPWNFGRR